MDNGVNKNVVVHHLDFLLMICFLLILFIILLLLSQNVQSTDVEGHITTNTTWNASQDPFTITDDIYVDEGITLTINPGVNIRFHGNYVFHVDGRLNAIGNETHPILFTSNLSDPSKSDWDSIMIYDKGILYMDHCNISYSKNGIYMVDSTNNTILNTTIYETKTGISLVRSSYNNIYNVHMENITQAIGLGSYSEAVKKYFNHSFTDCQVNGKSLIYLYDTSDVFIEYLNAWQIYLTWSENITINDCDVNNGEGITIYFSSYTTITNCDISGNEKGIYIYYYPREEVIGDSIKNVIKNNFLHKNIYGIYLVYSDENEIYSNNFTSSEYGIYSFYSYNNLFYQNNLYNNSINAYEASSGWRRNHWNNDDVGNYWDDYWGNDIGGGIGDRPYSIRSNSLDNLPLLNPWSGSLPPDTIPPDFSGAGGRVDILNIPGDTFEIHFTPSEYVYFEIVIDTDGTSGFDNTTDTVIKGNSFRTQYRYLWNGTNNDGEYVDDGEHKVQIMIWDKAGNPVTEPHDAGKATTIRDMDHDGVRDTEDAFPFNPTETEDFDGDEIGDNSDTDWDNDGVSNSQDEFPWDRKEWSDSDSDGIGDNSDADANGNYIVDTGEIPLVILILLIPFFVFYFTNKYIKKKKKEKEEGD